jgi:hypothetical protein
MIRNRNHRNNKISDLFKRNNNTRHRRAERKMQSGQILIIVVFAIVGLVAFVGLVVDTGLVFVEYGKLRRGTDAAALAAAAAYRQHPDRTDLSNVAMEYLTLNQVDNGNAEIHLLCDPTDLQYAPTQCQPAKRRLVKVDSHATVHLAFMPVLGITTVNLNATATSEAASLDIVLALDVSESMTFDNQPGKPGANPLLLDPAECNNSASGLANDYTQCEPFEKIQRAAVNFVDTLITDDNTYDRIAVIPFDRVAHFTKGAGYDNPLYLGDNVVGGVPLTPAAYRTKIENEIKGLRVYDGSGSAATGGPLTDGSCIAPDGQDHSADFAAGVCRSYEWNNKLPCFDDVTGLPTDLNNTACFSPTPNTGPMKGPYTADSISWYQRAYHYLICPSEIWAHCGTTATGNAFLAAGNEFVRPGAFRQESMWVVIMLTDGIANHATDASGDTYCPQSDGSGCQDNIVKTFDAGTRHCKPSGDPLYNGLNFLYTACISAPPDGGGPNTAPETMYDADDYARDMADFVSLGQQAIIYTIGFGTDMQHVDPISNSKAEQLLNYAADIGDDGKVNTPAGQKNANYFYAPDATQLDSIFTTIAQRIATRLTH